MKYSSTINSLNVRKNSRNEFYTAYTGRASVAKNLNFYGGVFKITFNNESVDYYENHQGQVVYELTDNASGTGKGLFFETCEAELLFLEQFSDCINEATKMVELIRIIKDAY